MYFNIAIFESGFEILKLGFFWQTLTMPNVNDPQFQKKSNLLSKFLQYTVQVLTHS